ncbi:hypothetical protein AVEN_175999-1 [Araneus ventricosus]|uniref:Uncharacterized protein n=1 Tax=Araneus ventricosus TaxID=182803 RepID=A0A4Y2EMY9_ARAVE|nr:hypothetical protein AVEN_175999-1 [Araneus ventricosus]
MTCDADQEEVKEGKKEFNFVFRTAESKFLSNDRNMSWRSDESVNVNTERNCQRSAEEGLESLKPLPQRKLLTLEEQHQK